MIPCSPAMYCLTFRNQWAIHFNCQTPFESRQTQSFHDQAYYGTIPFTQEGRVWAHAYMQVVSKECSSAWVISNQWQHYTHNHYRAAHCPPQQLLPLQVRHSDLLYPVAGETESLEKAISMASSAISLVRSAFLPGFECTVHAETLLPMRRLWF